MQIEFGDQALTLLPQRAAWWGARRTLILADPHFGKDAVFRRAGIAAPFTANHDLSRLAKLLDQLSTEHLLILGDFFHARPAANDPAVDALRAFRQAHRQLAVTLVRGNHDQAAGDPPLDLAIHCVDEPHALGPLAACHHPPALSSPKPTSPAPSTPAQPPTLAGHLHPVISLRDQHGPILRAPAFHLAGHVLHMPAFGRFTGGARVSPKPGDRVWAIDDDQVIDVTACC